MTAILLDVLSTSTHMSPDRAPATEERVRRMFRRLKISARDAEAWLGILRQILWELRHGKRPAGMIGPSVIGPSGSPDCGIIYTERA